MGNFYGYFMDKSESKIDMLVEINTHGSPDSPPQKNKCTPNFQAQGSKF